jgi:hypothetical protein
LSLVALSACSLTLSGPAADRRRGEVPRCDTSKGTVVLDGLAASALAVGGIAAASDSSSSAAVLPLAGAAVFALAALRGNGVVNDCRAAMGDYEAMRRAAETPVARAAEAEDEPTPEPLKAVAAPKSTEASPPPEVPPPATTPADADPWREFWKEVR